MPGHPQRHANRYTHITARLAASTKLALLLASVAVTASYVGDDATPAPDAPLTPPSSVSFNAPPAAMEAWTGFDPGDFRLSETGPEPTETADAAAEQRVLMVRRGDTLLELLLAAGVARAEAHEAVSALRAVYNPRDLKPGQEITLVISLPATGQSPALLSASLTASAERDISLSRDADGRFTALPRQRTLRRALVRATGTVRSSLFEAGASAEVPGTVMVELMRAFSYDVDFQRDIQPGDGFEVVFERYRDASSRTATSFMGRSR